MKPEYLFRNQPELGNSKAAMRLWSFLLVVFLSLSLSGCLLPGTELETELSNSTSAPVNATELAAVTSSDLDKEITVKGTIRQVRRYDSGHALVTLTDSTGELPVYIRRETEVDLLALSVGEEYEVSGKVQEHEGKLELAAINSNAFRLTDGYDFEQVVVESVIDGDTVRVLIENKPVTLRFIGVDTPEKPLNGQPAEYYADQATVFTTRLLKGKTVYLEKDNSDTDRYDRLLRYVWLHIPNEISPATLASTNLSALLIKNGYGEFIEVGDDNKYAAQFELWEQQAKNSKTGMWSGN
ncbi:MAG: thermonuclease family protein [Saccharofermentanales bacterium]|jgi:endonuclease YncB( thermonuclease family)